MPLLGSERVQICGIVHTVYRGGGAELVTRCANLLHTEFGTFDPREDLSLRFCSRKMRPCTEESSLEYCTGMREVLHPVRLHGSVVGRRTPCQQLDQIGQVRRHLTEVSCRVRAAVCMHSAKRERPIRGHLMDVLARKIGTAWKEHLLGGHIVFYER